MKIIENVKKSFLEIFSQNSSKQGLNKFVEMKRNRLIRKLRSNAIAIITNQIEIHSGFIKMNHYISRIEEIKPLRNINLKIFEDFYKAYSAYPIIEKKQSFNKEYLSKLEKELELIVNEYKPQAIEKCKEIIEKFEYIKTVC